MHLRISFWNKKFDAHSPSYNCKHQNKTKQKQNNKITNNEFKKQTYFKSSFAQQSSP